LQALPLQFIFKNREKRRERRGEGERGEKRGERERERERERKREGGRGRGNCVPVSKTLPPVVTKSSMTRHDCPFL
jgi:hypothetical protein